jgi:hypothetical protein
MILLQHDFALRSMHANGVHVTREYAYVRIFLTATLPDVQSGWPPD